MKRNQLAITLVLCIMFLAQTVLVFCDDSITVGRGEVISGLQLGLENMGVIEYDAIAEASGSAASWVSPTIVRFGAVKALQTKTATYTLSIPNDAKPGTYNLFWTFYALAGYRSSYLFMYSVTITVVSVTRSPVSLLPTWGLLTVGIVGPLWYWTRRK